MSVNNQDGTAEASSAATRQMRTFRFGSPGAEAVENPPKRAFLTVIRSRADLGAHLLVDEPTVVGRNPACAFPLRDYGVSWQHASITPCDEGEYVLEDLDSTNGTFINGVPIAQPRRLRDGEKIVAGETVIRFSLADELDVDFQQEVATMVGTDPLTGLESKRRFDEALAFALRSATKSGGRLAVMMMDMDGVKQINDVHGHLFGAHVIGETGRLIARVLGDGAHACRFGGDEFSAFLPAAGLASACDTAEQIRQAVATAGMEKDGIQLQPTISIGVACYPEAGNDLLQLVARADKALYRAKEQGKNRVAT